MTNKELETLNLAKDYGELRLTISIGFLLAFITLFVEFISEYLTKEYNFQHFYFFKPVLPVIFYYVLKAYFKKCYKDELINIEKKYN